MYVLVIEIFLLQQYRIFCAEDFVKSKSTLFPRREPLRCKVCDHCALSHTIHDVGGVMLQMPLVKYQYWKSDTKFL